MLRVACSLTLFLHYNGINNNEHIDVDIQHIDKMRIPSIHPIEPIRDPNPMSST
jgi:hypothetical protein